MSTILILVLGVMGAAAVYFFLTAGGKGSKAANPLAERLALYKEKTVTPLTTEEEDLQKSFVERIIQPNLDKLQKFLTSRTPAKTRGRLEQRLYLAGRPGNLTAGGFNGLRYVAALLGAVVGILVGLVLKNPLYFVLMTGGLAVAGYFFPVLWLYQKVGDRRGLIERGLPDVMDLLTISVEAGLGFDAAMSRVTEKFKNPLADEFALVLRETQLGRPRLEALEEMAERCGVDDLRTFVQAVVQSEQMGVGVAKILRLQSDEIRRKRRQKAQELAAQASLKMMLPMVGCIFPTLWIVLLGPAVIVLIGAMQQK